MHLVKPVKSRHGCADINGMIISDEQARLAAQYLRTSHPDEHATPHADIAPALLGAVMDALDDTPDVRADRVREATERLGSGELDSHEVAEKMISRIVSDSLR